MSAQQGSGGNVVAALASFFIPGLGQLCQGRGGAAIGYFLCAAALWILTLGMLGWIVNLFAALDAARWRPGTQTEQSSLGLGILAVVAFVVLCFVLALWARERRDRAARLDVPAQRWQMVNSLS
jgi:hypothetical protein